VQRLAQTAAAELDAVCSRCGWLSVEEGSKLRRGFVNRWAILWRDSARAAFEQVLLFYESEESAAPISVLQLTLGAFTVAPPKSVRRGFPHCFRIESHSPQGGTNKVILAAESAAENAAWCSALREGGGGSPTASRTRREAKQLAADRARGARQQLSSLAPKFAQSGFRALEVLPPGFFVDPASGVLQSGWVRWQRETGAR
jgi:hypothetical protein